MINLFFFLPHNYYYVRQLVRQTGEEINSVRRELKNLKDANLLNSEKRSHRLYYYPNPDSPLFVSLLILANQSSLLAQSLRNSGVDLLLYGFHFAAMAKTDTDLVDLLIVGNIYPKEVENMIKAEEKLRGREINYMIMGSEEFRLRKLKRDPILIEFLLHFPLIIIGDLNRLNHL